jgi:hypothetical protein
MIQKVFENFEIRGFVRDAGADDTLECTSIASDTTVVFVFALYCCAAPRKSSSAKGILPQGT